MVIGNTPETYEGSIQAYVDNAIPDITTILYAGETYLAANPGAFTANPKFVIVVEIQLLKLGFGNNLGPDAGANAYSFRDNYPFGSGVDTTALECVSNKIIPANVLLFVTFV